MAQKNVMSEDFKCHICGLMILYDYEGRQATRCDHHPLGPIVRVTSRGCVDYFHRGTNERVRPRTERDDGCCGDR